MARRGRAHHDVVCSLVNRFADHDVIRVAEIGVWTGMLSSRLLKQFSALHLSMIDPWVVLPIDHRDRELVYADQAVVTGARQKAKRITEFADDRRIIYPVTSSDAAVCFPDKTFDLVFIDGGHSTETVANDIRTYWLLVRSGGILSGHDYRTHSNHTRVKLAVDAWVAENDKQLHLHKWWVWHVEKE